MVPHSLLLLSLAMVCYSCKKDTNDSIPPDLQNPVSVYPVPPSKWMQYGSTVYYSSGFVGDPMPFFDNGKFHIFYLHDARDGQAGFHPIHKFVSSDLLHYDYEGMMVNYAGTDAQDLAIGTGSVVKAGNIYYCYYTGHNYLFPNTGLPKEGVMYATSTDLKTWTKKAGFDVIAPPGYDRNEFRDPHVFFNTDKNEYWMLVSARTGGKAVIALFTSANPATDNWVLKAPLFTTDQEEYFMLECADVFKWGNKWYLVFSENNVQKTTHYRIASSSEGPWTKPAKDTWDGEYFYAGKTASDGTNRFVFGWIATKENATDGRTKQWAGNLVAHQLTQETDGTLTVKAPASVTDLFSKEIAWQQSSSDGNVTLTGKNIRLQSSGTPAEILFQRMTGQKKITAMLSGMQSGSETGLVVARRTGSSDYYKISFNGSANTISCIRVSGTAEFTESTVPFTWQPGQDYDLKIIIDNSIAVVYLNNKVALSTRIYGMPNASWGLYASAGNVEYKNLQWWGY